MKKNLTLSKLMMIVVMAILPLTFYAQKNQSQPVERYFYIFAEGGLSINHTDLANYGFIPFIQDGKFVFNDGYVFKNFDGMLGIGYQMGKVVGINGKFGLGTLAGEKHGQWLQQNGLDPNTTIAYRQDLKLDKTSFLEGNVNLTFNLNNLFFGYKPRRVFNLIPHIGFGAIGYKAGAVSKTNPTVITTASSPFPIAAKTTREWTYTIPLGVELNFNLARKLDLFIDYTYTFAGNDKLDQVEKVFEDFDDKGNITGRRVDDIAIIKDMYSHLNLGLRFKFNSACDIEKMARNADQITYTVNPNPLEEKDGKVCFDVVFNVPGDYFEKDAVMNITPTLNTKSGSIDLEPVTFVGQRVKGQGDFVVNYSQGGEFTKHYCLDYTPDMENSTLAVNPMFYVYNGTIYPSQEDIIKNAYYTQGGERKIADGVRVQEKPKCEVSNIRTSGNENTITVSWDGSAVSYDIYLTQGDAPTATTAPTIAGLKEKRYTFSDVEFGKYNVYVKANCKDDTYGEWQEGKSVELIAPEEPICVFYFDKDKSSILGSGKQVRDRNKTARKTLLEKAAEGKNFRIEAWASPEGELDHNRGLADDRANAAVKDIKDQLKKNAGNYEYSAKGNGPDWNLFIELVRNSNLADKDQIVRVIENSRNREQEIKNMINVYPELEKDILPLIRRAEVYLK